MFLPTLLECFSVSYAEAMKMDRVILTSDLPFARNICVDAALYFDPLSPKDIGDMIYKAATDDGLRAQLIHNGRQQLSRFLSPEEKAAAYLKIIETGYETAHPVF
jgi:glycosyltransferase involved in cell wall biosynthesis